ncbi:MAG: acyltransferase family protein [Clostridium sp.]|uniref:acyltransferase family protein n=1 Tax=Clostridium sp. TaxID=1506 RepID=UPI002908B62F|nr:acyltransferase family protein [Clostridium sp.]MDU5208180.1 acyltransferase family protein [Clostridium sp.]MDU6760013.1 acyltransferase family protein [Clostridium sp.]
MTNTLIKKYNSIDLCKYFMAFLVVAIHTHPLEGCENNLIMTIYNTIVSFAVPFFFVSTGFLLFIKIKDDYYEKENILRVKKYIVKTIKLYLLWTIVYIPFAIYGYMVDSHGIVYNILEFFRGLFFIGEHFYSWPLWYLLSTIVSLSIIYALLKLKVSEKNILAISITIFLIANLMTYLTTITGQLSGILLLIVKLFKGVFGTGRLFTGLVYISVGMYIAKHDITVKKYQIISMVLLGFVGNCLLSDVIKDFALLVAVIGLFLLVISTSLKDSNIFYNLRKTSTVMYFTHMIFFFVYSYLLRNVGYYGVDAFIITVVSSLIFAKIVIILEKKDNMKWLKYLFG